MILRGKLFHCINHTVLYSLTGTENDGCGGKVFDNSVQCIVDDSSLFIKHNNLKVTRSAKGEHMFALNFKV